MLFCNSDLFSEFDHGFDAVPGVFQDIFIQNGGILFQQQHHRGAAELEVALLLAALNSSRAVVVDDLSNQQRTHLHCDDVAELPGMQDRVFPGIFLINGKMVVGDGVHRVENAFDAHVFPLFAVGNIAVAVIIVHRQAKQEQLTAPVFFCHFLIFQQRREGVFGVLDGEATDVFRYLYATPFVVYANFELQESDILKVGAENEIASYHLLNGVAELIGAPRSTYMAYLEAYYHKDPNYNVRLQRAAADASFVEGHRMLTYDIIAGARYLYRK